MSAYYNEIEPYAAAWLRDLIAAGHIVPGDVDERDIRDVRPDELRGYTQCHFFAGIGGWSYALRLAGWPDDRPVWTGSCPCQPFSSAGQRAGTADERHLWPHWFWLIAQSRPPVVFGEQVAAAIKGGWLDLVLTDLEAEGYACGAIVLPACGVGAPHIRQRLWFVADAGCSGDERGGRLGEASSTARQVEGEAWQRERSGVDVGDSRADGELAESASSRRGAQPQRATGADGRTSAKFGRLRDTDIMADADRAGRSQQRRGRLLDGERPAQRNNTDGRGAQHGAVGDVGSAGLAVGSIAADGRGTVRHEGSSVAATSYWGDCEWLLCIDGRARPVEPGTFPLAHGIPARVGKLRAYGNAIVPQVAAEFVRAYVGN